MDQDTLDSVLRTNCLPDGTVWTMPMILQISLKDKSSISCGDRIALQNKEGEVYAFIDVKEIFKLNLEYVSKHWFSIYQKSYWPGTVFIKRGILYSR